MQLFNLKRQRQQAALHQGGEVRFNQFKQHFTRLLAAFQAATCADFQRHMHEGIIMLPVGHLPGIDPMHAAANTRQRKNPRGRQQEDAGRLGHHRFRARRAKGG